MAALQQAGHLTVAGASKRFGAALVLDDLSLAVAKGEFVSLLGPSGCGKTTLLRCIAGLLRPDAGHISVAGRDITTLPAHRRNVGVVFQNYALFPHLTVAENIAFGLRAQGVSKSESAPRVAEALALVRMTEHAGKPVTALSGGQQQRVAVARALVVRPSLLLLDEPFSALDRKLRETMQVELKHLLREVGITAIFVTHDQEEALVVSDRIAVMNAGRIEQLADPATLYGRPASLYVLDFVGQSTRLAGQVTEAAGGMLAVQTALGPVRAPGQFAPGSRVVVAVRPEAVVLGEAAENRIAARVREVSFLGSRTQLHLDLPEEGEDRGVVELPRLPEGIGPGSAVTLAFREADTMVFPAP
ncbi:ABC transporter ATP-binding protein [Paracraurococcus ruber]|uniref:Spermidine/putrescine ABC transporter ATP-binding protein n=1 Tax=Paracraurococcus ruber TaxID=77675 RepID=A0ABS1D1Q0_9PROT|nr:ABC transporter ATP-binding protein [Paracraurococcus ruber]MBK1660438.1 spermidine/putrescine ABC transporter ATP-binding protein [Paracraurococcus ruber]TDG33591.1 ABC transporter ATP-binding protein [Paracraurococcus ruber]